jgi:rhomboid protease GluP
MPSADPINVPPGDPLPGELTEVGVYRTAAEGFDHGLVVLAAGHPYWLVPSERGYQLLVEPLELDWIRRQLALFDQESAGWPPAPDTAPRGRRLELATPLLWSLAVMAVFGCQGRWPGRLEDAGALDTQAVFDRGQWWRLGTSLFLHADVGHLVSNMCSGIFVFSAVLTTIGLRRGWCLLALASVTGNLAIAALAYPGPYRSLGASTAIFAGLGLLSGRAVRAGTRTPGPRDWRLALAPIAAALALLGLFGMGGLHVDVGAHATGLAGGVLWGFMAGDTGRPIETPSPGTSEAGSGLSR